MVSGGMNFALTVRKTFARPPFSRALSRVITRTTLVALNFFPPLKSPVFEEPPSFTVGPEASKSHEGSKTRSKSLMQPNQEISLCLIASLCLPWICTNKLVEEIRGGRHE